MAFGKSAVVAVFSLMITVTCIMPSATHASRDLPKVELGYDLAQRLEEGEGGMMECWNALLELRSCSNEIIIFFLNGQTEIGPGCCKAIDIITHHCWPSMLTSLGYTAEEGIALSGFCNASSSSSSPVSPVASPPTDAPLPAN